MRHFASLESAVRRFFIFVTLVQAAGLWLLFHEHIIAVWQTPSYQLYQPPLFFTAAACLFIILAGVGLGALIASPHFVTFLLAGAFYALGIGTLFSSVLNAKMSQMWPATAAVALLVWGIFTFVGSPSESRPQRKRA